MLRFLFFFVILLISLSLSAQEMWWEELEAIPEAVTNNAVAGAKVNGVPFVYSFSGLDESKECGKNHLRSFRYDTNLRTWEAIGDLPDSRGGKVAAGASTVKNKIYIIGGYHISNNCGEISSKKVNVYDPETNSYLADGADIPVAIDDHVQAVYRDSLIYVITGWSNTTNVTDVQIYDTANDIWFEGTPVPNDPEWRVFGASGTIVGDTIYYLGGAKYTCVSNACFEPSRILRKGFISPNDPTDITWSSVDASQQMGYRMGAFDYEGISFWFGGSELTYNFDGIDYNGTGGVEPLNRMLYLDAGKFKIWNDSFPSIMDLRGVAKIDDHRYVIAGGMLEGQVVSDRTIIINLMLLTNTIDNLDAIDFIVYPNPSNDYLYIDSDEKNQVTLTSLSGQLLLSKKISGNSRIDISDFDSGVYILELSHRNGQKQLQKVVIN